MSVNRIGNGAKWNIAHGTVSPLDTGNGSVSNLDSNVKVVAFIARDSGVTISSVVLDPTGTPQALTQSGTVANPAGTQIGEIWELAGPTAVTNKVVRVTFTGTGEVLVGATLYIDAPGTSTFSSTNGTTNSPSLAVTTANGDATITFCFDNKTRSLSNPGTGAQTTIEIQNINIDAGAGDALSTTTSDTHNWTYSAGTVSWGIAALRLSAGGGGGPTAAQEVPALLQAASGCVIGRVDA